MSIATGLFVVNNTKRVAPETRERIERAMAELGFRRNVVARALASRRTRIIALVYPVLDAPAGRLGDRVHHQRGAGGERRRLPPGGLAGRATTAASWPRWSARGWSTACC